MLLVLNIFHSVERNYGCFKEICLKIDLRYYTYISFSNLYLGREQKDLQQFDTFTGLKLSACAEKSIELQYEYTVYVVTEQPCL